MAGLALFGVGVATTRRRAGPILCAERGDSRGGASLRQLGRSVRAMRTSRTIRWDYGTPREGRLSRLLKTNLSIQTP